MKCTACGNDSPENAQFCAGCGASLSSGRVAARPGLPTVGFGEAISRGFTNYFTFSGRASRPEYWWWVLFTALVAIIPLSILVTFIPSLALASKKLHDIGKSGWSLILPLGGLILGFLILFSAGAYYESPWLLWLLALVPLALASKRLHDIGKSGWWLILPLGGLILGLFLRSNFALWLMELMAFLVTPVLFLGSIVLLIVWLAKKGDEGPNKYGPDPRQAASQLPYKP